MSNIICVKCGSILSLEQSKIICDTCNTQYDKKDDIPLLLEKDYTHFNNLETEYRTIYPELKFTSFKGNNDFLAPKQSLEKFKINLGYYYRHIYHFGYIYDKFESTIRYFFNENKNMKIKILDVGTGLSNLLYVAETIAIEYNIDIELYGIDIVHSGMSTVQKMKPNKRIKFICADAENLPFQNLSFDFIFSINAIEHGGSKMTSEMMRVLKEDGRLLIIGPSIYGQFIHNVLFGRRNRKYLLSGQFDKIDPHGVKFAIIKNQIRECQGEVLWHKTDNYFRAVQERISDKLNNHLLIKVIFQCHNIIGFLFNNRVLKELNFMQYIYVTKSKK